MPILGQHWYLVKFLTPYGDEIHRVIQARSEQTAEAKIIAKYGCQMDVTSVVVEHLSRGSNFDPAAGVYEPSMERKHNFDRVRRGDHKSPVVRRGTIPGAVSIARRVHRSRFKASAGQS